MIFPYWVSISITSLNLTLARDWINFIEASLSMLATSSGYKSYIFFETLLALVYRFFFLYVFFFFSLPLSVSFFFFSWSILSNARRKMEIKSRYGNGDIRTGIYVRVVNACALTFLVFRCTYECVYQSTFSLDELSFIKCVESSSCYLSQFARYT